MGGLAREAGIGGGTARRVISNGSVSAPMRGLARQGALREGVHA